MYIGMKPTSNVYKIQYNFLIIDKKKSMASVRKFLVTFYIMTSRAYTKEYDLDMLNSYQNGYLVFRILSTIINV